MEVVGYEGGSCSIGRSLMGTPRKLLDVCLMRDPGWTAMTGLKDGIGKAYADFLSRYGTLQEAG